MLITYILNKIFIQDGANHCHFKFKTETENQKQIEFRD